MADAPTLVLTLTGKRIPAGVRRQMEYHEGGGSMGRSEDCDWVLASPGVSRVHAVVRHLNGLYFIEDRSTNGIALNGKPLTRGEPATVAAGDRLQLDGLDIEVEVREGSDAVAPMPTVDDTSVSTPGVDLLADPGSHPQAVIDPLQLLDALRAPRAAEIPAPVIADPGWDHLPPASAHFSAPRTKTADELLPDRWDLTVGDFAAGAVAAAPAAPLRSPGVEKEAEPDADRTPASALQIPDMGKIFAIVVAGVMDVLRARAEIKNTFRLPTTIIQRSENNPLKFAATPDEAIRRLIRGDGVYLGGPEAFDDAFDDISCHQAAMLAGMRAAYDALLAHFNPDRVESEADVSGRPAFAGKGRYWDYYRARFGEAMRDPDEGFRTLFGDDFARAYEVQLARLKSARRTRSGARTA